MQDEVEIIITQVVL